MAGGSSGPNTQSSSQPQSASTGASSVTTPQAYTLPSSYQNQYNQAPSSIYNATPTPRTGFYQQGAPSQSYQMYQPYNTPASYMPQQMSGYGRFTTPPPQAYANRPTADQVRAQMNAYSTQYEARNRAAQQSMQQYYAKMRQAEADRKAEIARKEAEAKAKAEAEAAAAAAQSSNGEGSEGNGAQMAGATGGLASLKGFN